ncbi:hypothetical protein BDW62DRAFT_59924 [Aspergillus aurantiobrunneus]
MQQEARNTEGRNIWRLNSKLRHQAIQFVSAGCLEPAQHLKPISTSEDGLGNEKNCTGEGYKPVTTDTSDYKLESNPAGEITTTTRPVLPIRPRSRTSEDSSEDEVVFRGRHYRSESSFNSRIGSQNVVADSDVQEDIDDRSPDYTQIRVGSAKLSSDSATSTPCREKSPNWIRIDQNSRPRMSDEDEILADYVAHIDYKSEDDDDSLVEQPLDNGRTAAAGSGALTRLSKNEDVAPGHHDLSPADVLKDETHYFLSDLSQSTRKGSEKGIFASAIAFADALELDPYYGLDVMNFSRGSIRKNKKNKKNKGHQHLDFEALGTDLGSELVSAWNNDRLKKKSKKREREKLRAQGLLGRRKIDPDLKTKYAEGIGIEDLKSEIRLFLLSQKNSLSLPPMTKHRRMLIHDMAHALRLTSQSRGKGSSRFPILSKTSRTPKYTHKTAPQIDRVFSKRLSPRALKAWDNTNGRSAKAKRGHGNVSYMDGDVVGASAPEIGAENKGRAMLEKMGWSTGTALGANNNKGILLPVAHVVKNSKTGLG